jgi:hypothetical protein
MCIYANPSYLVTGAVVGAQSITPLRTMYCLRAYIVDDFTRMRARRQRRPVSGCPLVVCGVQGKLPHMEVEVLSGVAVDVFH